MHPRTILNALHLRLAAERRPPTAGRRPAVYLGVAVAGAAVVNLVVGSGPAAHAEAVQSESVSVAEQLGVDGTAGPADVVRGLEPLAGLAASRSSRVDAEFAAQLTQAAADQAVLDQQRAEAEAAARRAAEEAAAKRAAELAQLAELAAAQAKAAALAPAAKTPAAAVAGAAGSVAATTRAKISNSAGAINPRAQAAADAVVSNVPGAASITLGGTRASAADPGGHPSGLAVDYMVMANGALGDAIVAYHVAHWNELGVEYLIWKQRMMSSPGGGWKPMENRGSATANHMDHVHVNYR